MYPIWVVITVQGKITFFIAGCTFVYNETILEQRREIRINVGETSLSFLELQIFIPPPNIIPTMGSTKLQVQSVPKFPYTVRDQPDPEYEYVISGSAYIKSLRPSGYFISN
jgi:hypothetical protein